jgi:hypothetical protein
MPAGLTGDRADASKNRLWLTGDWLAVGLGAGALCGAVGLALGWCAGARCVGRLGLSAGSRRGLLGGDDWTGRGCPMVWAGGDECCRLG